MRDLVRVLAEPNRRRLLELLRGGEQSVGVLVTHFDISQPAISQHLGVLAEAGLVEYTKRGRFRYYRLSPEGMANLRRSLEVFWSQELDELAASGPPREVGTSMALEKSVVVPLGPEETFALLTEPERLRRWATITARLELRAGGTYRWTMTPANSVEGTVIEVEPGRRLVLSWGWSGASSDLRPGASTVTVTFEPVAAGTLVTLIHEGLAEDQVAGHSEGWDHFLSRLATAGRDGDAGPDEWSAGPDPSDPLAISEAALAVCQEVLRDLDDSSRSLPTPCRKYRVDELLDHLLGSIAFIGSLVGAPAPQSTGSLEERVADAAQVTLERWRARGTEGEVPSGPGTMAASVAVDILSLELLVHAWDFGRATGRTVAASDALARATLDIARQVIRPEMRDGDRFAEPTEEPPGATDLERLMAFTGRIV